MICRCQSSRVYLSQISDIYQPKTISSLELKIDGKYDVFGANGIIGKYSEYNHKTPQICLTCRGNTCGTINYSNPFSWITGNAMVINVDNHSNEVNKRFLYHYLTMMNFAKYISGSGQPQIVREPLQKLLISLPSMAEQIKIGSNLDAYVNRIRLEQRILNLYQSQKEYLLRTMFI